MPVVAAPAALDRVDEDDDAQGAIVPNVNPVSVQVFSGCSSANICLTALGARSKDVRSAALPASCAIAEAENIVAAVKVNKSVLRITRTLL